MPLSRWHQYQKFTVDKMVRWGADPKVLIITPQLFTFEFEVVTRMPDSIGGTIAMTVLACKEYFDEVATVKVSRVQNVANELWSMYFSVVGA